MTNAQFPLLKIFLTGLGHKNDQFVQRKGQDMHESAKFAKS